MSGITLPTEIVTSDKTPRTAIAFDKTSGAKQIPDTAREVLLVGMMTADATIAAATPTVCSREDDGAQAGPGSMLDVAARAAFRANPFVKLSIVGVAEAGVKASATVTYANNADISTIHRLRVAGKEYAIDLTVDDTPTEMGDNLVTRITADPQAIVTAVNASGVVTLTAINGGTEGNGIQLRSSIDAPVDLVTTTATLSAAHLGSGTGSADLTDALAAATGKRYHVIGILLGDSTAGGVAQGSTDEEGDAEHSHGEIYVQVLDGVLSDQTTLALANNAARGGLGSINGSETWAPEICAAWAASDSREEVANRPRNGMVLNGVLPPPVATRWTRTETRTLLDNGCTPLVVLPGDQVAVQRFVATGITNVAGDLDYSTLDITKILAFDRFRDAIKLMMDTNYRTARWADSDPDGLLPTDVATPEKVRIDLIDVARDMEAEGIVQNVEALKDQFVVEKHGTQCWFSVPALIVDGMHEKLGKIVNILRLPIS